MFDPEETTAIVVLITDGHEIFAIEATRTGNFTYKTTPGNFRQLEAYDAVIYALSICKKGRI